MRHMEQSSNGSAHAVDDGYRRIIKRHPCLQSRQRHLNPALLILPVLPGSFKKLKDPLTGRQRKGIRKRLRFSGSVSLQSMGQRIDPCGSRNVFRNRQSKPGIDHSHIRRQGWPLQQHLHLAGPVCDDGKLGRLGTGPRRGGDSHHGSQLPGHCLS